MDEESFTHKSGDEVLFIIQSETSSTFSEFRSSCGRKYELINYKAAIFMGSTSLVRLFE